MTPGPIAGVGYDLSGITVRLRGIPPGCHRLLREVWAPFAPAPALEAPFLDVAVRLGPDRTSQASPLELRLDGPVASFRMPEGQLRVAADGRTELVVRTGSERELLYRLLNLLLPALAWSLPTRGMLLLHAAGIVVDGTAFVLVGQEGAGKSTWASVARGAGAAVLSDDLIVVDASTVPVQVLSLPFRAGDPPVGPGRWPVARVMFAAHGAPPGLEPVERMQARSRLVANLPYVAAAIEADRRVGDLVERLLGGVEFARLTFARDPSFLELLRGP
jgi:hypothetical protein